MSIVKNDSRVARFDEAPLELAVLLVYEDGPTALRGKRTLDRVLNQRAVMAEGQFHCWRMDLLRDPACQAEAARVALDADIVVVSAHGPNRLALGVEASLKEWLGLKRSRPCALVLSLDADANPKGKSHPALLALRAEAARKGLTVLFQFGEAMRPELSAAFATIPERAENTPPVLDQILHRPGPHSHWGLNE